MGDFLGWGSLCVPGVEPKSRIFALAYSQGAGLSKPRLSLQDPLC